MGTQFDGGSAHECHGYDYHVQSIGVRPDDTTITITWQDPCDIEWIGTKIIRKEGGYPRDITDGVLVLDNKIRHQYSITGYKDTGLVNGTVYYYKAYPYSYVGVNSSYLNQATPIKAMLKGVIAYTGAHTVTTVEHEGRTWAQWTLLGSGTLTVTGYISLCKICVVGGGGGGGFAGGYPGSGGAGGYMSEKTFGDIAETTIVVVGLGGRGGTAAASAATEGGQSAFGSITALGGSVGKSGGSGAGGTTANGGNGDGLPKYPFGDTAFFTGKPHCAGGGGGGRYTTAAQSTNSSGHTGGAGGSNGGNGAAGVAGSGSGGPGGLYGGGLGGYSGGNGGAGSFYGAGGGGGGYAYTTYTGANVCGSGGNGYQGVVYLRVLKEDLLE